MLRMHVFPPRHRALTALAAAGAVALAACGSSGGGSTAPAGGVTAAGTPITVVAAENFWGNITSQIGGSHVAVTSIISDPNADPHQYESDPKDGAALSRAAFVIENGVGYDDFVDKLLAASPRSGREVLSIEKAAGVSGDNPNPHLWYSPAYVTAAAKAIEAQLEKADPADATTFQANLATFVTGEQGVVAVIDQIKAKFTGTPVAYTERVPGYLVEAAGLKLGTPASFARSIEDGNEPSPGDTAAFDTALRSHAVKVLLYNSQVTSPITQKARALATASGIPVVGVSETLPPGEKDFQTWQADQARAILATLGQ
jgi:zinc/manganese transport system substrate-binding protein